MKRLLPFLASAALGALLGAILLGAGGRIIMRLLTLHDGREPGFSLGGSAEIVAYGAIVGLLSGAAYGALPGRWKKHWVLVGAAWGGLSYLAALLTLPAHIAQTAAPFRDIMVFVHLAFGGSFLAFGLALARLRRRDVA